MKYVCELEGHQNIVDRENKLRKAITDVAYCDITKQYPVGTSDSPRYDCVLTGFCIEAVANSRQQWAQYVKNASNLLNSGGWFVQISMPADYYGVGDKRLHCFKVDEKFLLKSLKDAGLVVEKTYHTKHTTTCNYMNYEFTMVMIARKI
ncbi:nicotinamide N-methyltransferase-like [Saccoglossus kowalevskii]